MAINRELLQKELARAGQIRQAAISGEGFDPRGGYGVLAAQLGTAAIGAFAEKKARDKLMAENERRKQKMGLLLEQKGISSEFADLLSPTSQDALVQQIIKSELTPPTAPKYDIRESEGGFVRIDPQTGTAEPIKTTQGEQLRSKVKKPLVEVKTGELETEERKQLGKVFAKKYESISDAGDQARRGIETLETLKQAVSNPDAAQGAFADLRAGSKKVADLFGFDVEGLEDDAIIAAVGNKLALQLRNPKGEDGGLTGATSDRDLRFLVAGVPNRNKTQSQNLALIEVGMRDKERTLQLKNLADQYLSEKGTFKGFAKVKKEFYENNPLFPDKEDKARISDMLRGNAPRMTPAEQPATGGSNIIDFNDL